MSFLAVLVVGSFVFVDIAGPRVEAAVFAAITGTTTLFYLILRDLSDPFGGVSGLSGSSSGVARVSLGSPCG